MGQDDSKRDCELHCELQCELQLHPSTVSLRPLDPCQGLIGAVLGTVDSEKKSRKTGGKATVICLNVGEKAPC